MFARGARYAVDGFLASILRVTDRIMDCTLCLINFAFDFKFLAASDMSNNFLSLADNDIYCTLNVFIVHVPPLHC
jgi:hypothetical protein